MGDGIHATHLHVKTVDDERRIYRAVPIAEMDSSIMLLNGWGATLCKPDHQMVSLDLPEADEVSVGTDGTIYACWFKDDTVRIQAYQCDATGLKSIGLSSTLNICGLTSNDLVVLDAPEGVELWLDTAQQCRRIWAVSRSGARRAPAAVTRRPEGELLFSSGKIAGFVDDLGVKGVFLSVVDLASQKVWRVRSTFAFSALERVFAISDTDAADDGGQYGLHVFSNGGKPS